MRVWQQTLAFPVLALLLVVCSSGSDEQPGGDADADIERARPEPPLLTPCPDGWVEVPDAEGGVTTCDPWPGSSPVTMTPCPDGWREVDRGGVVTCDPWSEGGPLDCEDDEAHFPGEPGCRLIGTPCADGDWAVDLPLGEHVLYVLSGAAAGGDGSEDTPFGTIAEAMSDAEEGTVIALSKGTFDEEVSLRRGVTLWGACTGETVLASSTPTEFWGTVIVSGAGTSARNLQISGERPGVFGSRVSSYSIHLQDVLISEVRSFGIFLTSGQMTCDGVVVRDTRGGEDGTLGVGLYLQEGAQADVSRSVFERNRTAGVVPFGATVRLTLEDVAVRDTESQTSDRLGGSGVDAQEGAEVQLNRCVIEGSRGFGVFAQGAGTTITLDDVVVRDTLARERDGAWGRGLEASLGALVEVHAGLFEGNRQVGVFAGGADTTLLLYDVVVRDTQGQEAGRGINVETGATVEIHRTVVSENQSIGVNVVGEGAVFHATDAIISDTSPREGDGQGGIGLAVLEGGRAEMSSVAFLRNVLTSISALSGGTEVTLSDALFHANGQLEVGFAARADMQRVYLLENTGIGVFATHLGTTVSLEDTLVRDTHRGVGGSQAGRGIEVSHGALLTAERVLLDGNHEIGVLSFGDSSSIRMVDVSVVATRPRECDTVDCAVFGDGVGSRDGAAIDLRRFAVSDNSRCGVAVKEADVDLQDGMVSGNVIGACVRDAEFDLERLMDNVLFQDNELRLDPNFTLPVPEPALPPESE